MTSWIMIAAAILAGFITLNPRILRSTVWRATVTPLASIIGSGFLIAGPILADATGRAAVIAIAGLCAAGWLFGSAVRYNIRHAEPLIEPDGSPLWLERLDKLSDLALACAYFVSVAYYLNLFSAFALRMINLESAHTIKMLTSFIIIVLGLIGTFRGLRWLENIELPAVGIKLALISGMLVGLVWTITETTLSGRLELPHIPHATGMHELGILLGLIIMVQGFETSRYLGHTYDAETRIKTMRRAQIIATMVYIPFIALITPMIANGPPHGKLEETAIIDIMAPLGWAVAPLVIMTALASQLSAAIADMNGAGGLVRSASSNRIGVRWGYAATASVAVFITLSANIFEIIAYASKAFVFYYGLQSLTAALLSQYRGRSAHTHTILYMAGVCLAILVIWLGIPAEG